MEVTVILWPLLCAILLLAMHIIVNRFVVFLKWCISWQLLLGFCILFMNIPLLFGVYILTKHLDISMSLNATIYSIMVYDSLAYFYFHIFNMSDTARRIKLIIDIKLCRYQAEDQQVDVSGMINNRLERLIGMKQVELIEGRYFLKSRFLLYVSRVLKLWRIILNTGG